MFVELENVKNKDSNFSLIIFCGSMCKQKKEFTSLDVITYPQLYIPTIAVHSLLDSSAREAEAESNPY